jgi:hypothetical protein
MSIFNINAHKNFIMQFANKNFDPFVDDYLGHAKNLIQIIEHIGEPLEGNIFYKHLETNFKNLDPAFLPKRRSLALLAMMHNNICEIGFNSGFSALLLLSANPLLSLTCIDICEHAYSIPCFNYLSSKFPGRITLINSDSRMAMPSLSRINSSYGAFIIDGGHGIDIAETDLLNTIQYSEKGTIICFDDSDSPYLRTMLNLYILKGTLINIHDQLGFIDNNKQMFFINNK